MKFVINDFKRLFSMELKLYERKCNVNIVRRTYGWTTNEKPIVAPNVQKMREFEIVQPESMYNQNRIRLFHSNSLWNYCSI